MKQLIRTMVDKMKSRVNVKKRKLTSCLKLQSRYMVSGFLIETILVLARSNFTLVGNVPTMTTSSPDADDPGKGIATLTSLGKTNKKRGSSVEGTSENNVSLKKTIQETQISSLSTMQAPQ
jgi:hypothetical protein